MHPFTHTHTYVSCCHAGAVSHPMSQRRIRRGKRDLYRQPYGHWITALPTEPQSPQGLLLTTLAKKYLLEDLYHRNNKSLVKMSACVQCPLPILVTGQSELSCRRLNSSGLSVPLALVSPLQMLRVVMMPPCSFTSGNPAICLPHTGSVSVATEQGLVGVYSFISGHRPCGHSAAPQLRGENQPPL